MATDSVNMLKALSSLEREEGILCLSSYFQWREFGGDGQRQHLLQEFVYENVMYSAKRGLPWSAVAQIANMTKELLPELEGLEKFEVISLIQARLLQCQPPLSAAQYFALRDFIVKDYIHHQRLYQALLKGERNLKCKQSQLVIHVPPHALPLCEGTEMVMWEKRQALQELITAEAEKRAEIQRLREQAEKHLTVDLPGTFGDLSLDNRLDKQAVQTMIHATLQFHGDIMKKILLMEIKAVQELLELRLSQKSLLEADHTSDASSLPDNLPVSSFPKAKKK